MTRPARKFDPAKAARLDAPERERYLSSDELGGMLWLEGDETVVDYGAGTGRVSLAAARRLVAGGKVVAVEESEEMLTILRERLASNPDDEARRVEPMLIEGNRVPLPDGSVDRILAVNLLHEVRGEQALAEMRRLLTHEGMVLVADWERGREHRDVGPPDELLYTEEEARAELERAGFEVEPVAAGFPFHFALTGRPR